MPQEKPVRVEKPWGHELIWARTDRYVGKILHVREGHALSLQYHVQKDESIFVQRGTLDLVPVAIRGSFAAIHRRSGGGTAASPSR